MITENIMLNSNKSSLVDTLTDTSNSGYINEFDLKGLDFLTEPNHNKFQTQSALTAKGSGTLGATASDFLLVPPIPKRSREYFNALQKWEGFVTEIEDEVFRSRLVPIIGQGDEQEAEIYISEVTEEDRSMIKVGSVFYWSIGYLERPSGRLRASIIRFRRLPKWTAKEIDEASKRVKNLKELFGE